MANAIDILLDENNELQFENGDYKTGYSDGQHVKHILFAELGNYRQSILTGIGIRRVLNVKASPHTIINLKKQITTQLTDDGYKVDNIKITPGKLQIDSERVS